MFIIAKKFSKVNTSKKIFKNLYSSPHRRFSKKTLDKQKKICYNKMVKSVRAKTSISSSVFQRAVGGCKTADGREEIPFASCGLNLSMGRSRSYRRRPLSAEVLFGTRRGSCRKASAKQSGIAAFAVPALFQKGKGRDFLFEKNLER